MDTQDTNAEDAARILAQLRDIHLPPAPAEPAIWPLLVAGVIILLAAILWLRRARQNKGWAATATQELKQIQAGAEPAAALRIAELLKRIVLTHDNRPEIKHLSGSAWLGYLDKFFQTQFFTTGAGQLFGESLYQQQQSLAPHTYTTLRKLIRRRQWQND